VYPALIISSTPSDAVARVTFENPEVIVRYVRSISDLAEFHSEFLLLDVDVPVLVTDVSIRGAEGVIASLLDQRHIDLICVGSRDIFSTRFVSRFLKVYKLSYESWDAQDPSFFSLGYAQQLVRENPSAYPLWKKVVDSDLAAKEKLFEVLTSN